MRICMNPDCANETKGKNNFCPEPACQVLRHQRAKDQQKYHPNNAAAAHRTTDVKIDHRPSKKCKGSCKKVRKINHWGYCETCWKAKSRQAGGAVWVGLAG